MRCFLLALMVLASLPLVSAGAGWENVTWINPDGYVDTALQGLGMNMTSDNITGGGGNPLGQYVYDPIVNWFNETLGTKWGFILLIALMAIISGFVLIPLAGGFFVSYIGYLIGMVYELSYTILLMMIFFTIGFFLFWKFTHKSDLTDKYRKLFKVLLVLYIVIVIALVAINAMGWVIPGLTD